jgi:hypothetical protein
LVVQYEVKLQGIIFATCRLLRSLTVLQIALSVVVLTRSSIVRNSPTHRLTSSCLAQISAVLLIRFVFIPYDSIKSFLIPSLGSFHLPSQESQDWRVRGEAS